MKKLFLIIILLACVACDETPLKPMTLEYAIYYPDTVVVKHYDFYGNDKARAFIGISGGLRSRYNYIQLYNCGLPGYPYEGIRSLAPIDIIDIYPKDNQEEKK